MTDIKNSDFPQTDSIALSGGNLYNQHMKKIFIFLASAVFCCHYAAADIIDPNVKGVCINKTGKRIICPEYKRPKYEYEELIPFTKIEQPDKSELETGKYAAAPRRHYLKELTGFKDKAGNVVIEPQFDSLDRYAANFTGRYYPVSKNGRYGLIDRQGNWIIEPQFDLLLRFSEGLAPACLNGRCGYVDEQFNWAIEPRFGAPMCFSKYSGSRYERLHKCFNSSGSFSEGLAAVHYKTYYFAETGRCINKPDSFLLDIEALEYIPAEFPMTVFGKIKDRKFYLNTDISYEEQQRLYDLKKQIKSLFKNPKTRKEAETLYNEMMSGDTIAADLKIIRKCGYINKQGKFVLKGYSCPCGAFSEGLAAVPAQDGSYGYIDKNGSFVIEAQFKEAGIFKNGAAYVKKYMDYDERLELYKKSALRGTAFFIKRCVIPRKHWSCSPKNLKDSINLAAFTYGIRPADRITAFSKFFIFLLILMPLVYFLVRKLRKPQD